MTTPSHRALRECLEALLADHRNRHEEEILDGNVMVCELCKQAHAALSTRGETVLFEEVCECHRVEPRGEGTCFEDRGDLGRVSLQICSKLIESVRVGDTVRVLVPAAKEEGQP